MCLSRFLSESPNKLSNYILLFHHIIQHIRWSSIQKIICLNPSKKNEVHQTSYDSPEQNMPPATQLCSGMRGRLKQSFLWAGLSNGSMPEALKSPHLTTQFLLSPSMLKTLTCRLQGPIIVNSLILIFKSMYCFISSVIWLSLFLFFFN